MMAKSIMFVYGYGVLVESVFVSFSSASMKGSEYKFLIWSPNPIIWLQILIKGPALETNASLTLSISE